MRFKVDKYKARITKTKENDNHYCSKQFVFFDDFKKARHYLEERISAKIESFEDQIEYYRDKYQEIILLKESGVEIK